MSTKITIEISLTADEQPNAREQAILNSMAAHPANGAAAAPVATVAAKAEEAPAPAKAPVAAEAPAKRPVGRPRAALPTAPVAAPEPAEVPMALDTTLDVEEEVVEELEEDLMGEDEATTHFTKEDAIAAATKLVSNQKQAVVKAALVKAGAKRVSDLNDAADIQVFMAALEA